MTKNRAHKQTVRAAQAATGSNYTTALRAHTGTAIADHPFRLVLPTAQDGTRSVLDLGDGTTGPVAWLGGEIGSGRSVLVNQIMAAFLDRNPAGTVVWLDPKGYGPAVPTGERVRVFSDGDAAASAAMSSGTAAEPMLVVIEDLLLFTEVSVERSEALREAVEEIARTGRSTGTRLLVCSPIAPLRHRVGDVLFNAIGTRGWVARSTPLIWEQFFGATAVAMTDDRLSAPRGQAWVQYGRSAPTLVHFPPPTDLP